MGPLLLSRLRLLLLQNVNTLYGLEDLFLHPYLPFKVCGSAKRNTTNLVHLLSTENAFKPIKKNSTFRALWSFFLIFVQGFFVPFKGCLGYVHILICDVL